MDLEQIREQIDSLDQQIVELIGRRMDLSGEVAAYKKANHLPIYHPEREAKVIEKVTSRARSEYSEAVAAIYQCIMDESKKVQKKLLPENSDR